MTRTSSLNTAAASVGKTITYQNPVWPNYFADPFVLRVGRTYWAYGTAPGSADGMELPVLRSENLASWTHVGHALRPLAGAGGHNFWAPEVADKDGRFYLFYSSAPKNNDDRQRIR